MHLTHGTLDTSITLFTSVGGAIALGAAFWGARRQLSTPQVPALLVMSSFVFIAQMVNCSTGFGFSGHLVGASLLAVFFGPYAAMLSMATILALQAGLLGDGSFSTLGANFLVMGVVAPWVAYGLFQLLRGGNTLRADAKQVGAMAGASFASIVAASLCLSGMIGSISTAEMLPIAAVWGALEAIIAVAVFALCVSSESDRFAAASRLAFKPLAFICFLTLCLVPFSSQEPDGLEHVLEVAQLSGEPNALN